MRTRVALFLATFIFTTSAFAIDRWILISGTVANFHTDARLFNPSFDTDIQVTATFFPTDGSAPLTATITVPKRQMKILDDVTTQLFSTSKLGAIQFTSSSAFEATSRIYAQTAAGTLGQFGPGTAPTLAKQRGALLQLKQNGVNGQSGTFRTNVGVVNPNNVAANVTWTIYDKNNAVIGTNNVTYAPMSATAPTLMTAGNVANVTSGDFSDSWLAFSSDQPIFVYASVIDNGTTDQTFIPAVDDAGTPPSTTPPPAPTTQNFDVTLQNFSITVTPDPSTLKVGDTAVFHIRVANGSHTFEMVGPAGDILIPPATTGSPSFTITAAGTYSYFCTNALCGTGHAEMQGSFDVQQSTPNPGRGY